MLYNKTKTYTMSLKQYTHDLENDALLLVFFVEQEGQDEEQIEIIGSFIELPDNEIHDFGQVKNIKLLVWENADKWEEAPECWRKILKY